MGTADRRAIYDSDRQGVEATAGIDGRTPVAVPGRSRAEDSDPSPTNGLRARLLMKSGPTA